MTKTVLDQAREDYLRRYDLRDEFDSTFTSVLGLHFEVLPMHFRRSAMILKCTSSMLSVYWQSSEVSCRKLFHAWNFRAYWKFSGADKTTPSAVRRSQQRRRRAARRPEGSSGGGGSRGRERRVVAVVVDPAREAAEQEEAEDVIVDEAGDDAAAGGAAHLPRAVGGGDADAGGRTSTVALLCDRSFIRGVRVDCNAEIEPKRVSVRGIYVHYIYIFVILHMHRPRVQQLYVTNAYIYGNLYK